MQILIKIERDEQKNNNLTVSEKHVHVETDMSTISFV